MTDIKIPKHTLQSIGIILITFYFVFDGMQRIFNNSTESMKFQRKMSNIESFLYNHDMLLIEFSAFTKLFSNLITLIIGALEVSAAGCLFFFKIPQRRVICSWILFWITIFDSLVCHFPFNEQGKMRYLETRHSVLGLAIAAGVLMVGGIRY